MKTLYWNEHASTVVTNMMGKYDREILSEGQCEGRVYLNK